MPEPVPVETRVVRPSASADGAFLVAVEVGDLGRNPLREVRMEQAVADQSGDFRPLPERAREAHVGSLEKRGAAGLVEREEFAHLRVQVRVREGIRGELVAKETPDDVLGVRDGVQRHEAGLIPSRLRRPEARPRPTD